MPASSFTRAALLMLAGPLIWALHFLVIYGLTGITCARPAWLGIGVIVWGIGLAAVAAIGAIAAIHLCVKRKHTESAATVFMRRIATLLGVVSTVAIVWETVPVFFVSECA